MGIHRAVYCTTHASAMSRRRGISLPAHLRDGVRLDP